MFTVQIFQNEFVGSLSLLVQARDEDFGRHVTAMLIQLIAVWLCLLSAYFGIGLYTPRLSPSEKDSGHRFDHAMP